MASVRVFPAGTFPSGGDIKTFNVVAAPPAGAPNQFKYHTQIGPGGYVDGTTPVIQLAPTGGAGFKTVVIPGFTGPA